MGQGQRVMCNNCFGEDEGCRMCGGSGFVGGKQESGFDRLERTLPPAEEQPGSEIEPVTPSGLLPEERKAIIDSDTTDDLLRAFVSRYGDNLEERTHSYRKIAEAARAEADALMAIHELTLARRYTAIPATGSEDRDDS